MATKKRRGVRKKPRGRPKGSGGPPEKLRRNRVVVMVTDAELAKLHRLAEARDVPLGTRAHELLSQSLRRAR